MGDATQSQALIQLDMPSVLLLISHTLQLAHANQLISEIYHPLITQGQDARLQEIFTATSGTIPHKDQLILT